MLVGIVLIVVGAITGLDSDRGRLALLCGLVLASLGGLDTALREHFNGFRSHSSVLAGLPAVLVAGALFFGRAPWIAVIAAGVRRVRRSASGPSGPRSGAGQAACRSAEIGSAPVSDERRMQLRGLHHVTAICRDLETTIAFYRDVHGARDRPRRPQRRRPGHAPRVVRRARGAGRDAAVVHGVPAAAQGRDRRRLHAPLRARRRLRRRSSRRGATTCGAKKSSAPTSTTAARSGRCTCTTPTATWWRSPPGGRALCAGPRG